MFKKVILISALVLFIFLSQHSFANEELVDILLLNSYHDGYQWSNDTKQGVKDVLDAYTLNYHMRIEHMDSKNISTDDYMLALVELYKIKYEADEFDLIICADDNALKFLLKYRDQLFDNTPVFFCGVNTLATHDFRGAENFYGVVEKHSIASTTKMALKLNPDLKHVYLVVDNSITGKSTQKDAIEDMRSLSNQVDLHLFEEESFSEIMEIVSELNPQDSIVIQSFYVVDQDGSTYPLDYTAQKLIEHSSVPVFGIFSFGFGEGVVGGKFVEGYTQGERVAKMVTSYLDKGVVEGIRYIVDESFNRYYFDYEVMKKYSYDMKLLPDKRILINVPITFYQRHNGVINVSLGLLFLLIIYVYLLRRQIRAQTKKIFSAQTQLIEAEKMASLGRLVAGVAHEVNTPIGIGVSLASYIKVETSKVVDAINEGHLSQNILIRYFEHMDESAESMGKTMEQASKLIQKFKQVAVDQTLDDKRFIEVGQYIEDIVASMRSELRQKDIDVVVDVEEEIHMVCYTGAIYQIMLNLIMNSIKHGFDDRDNGVIKIELKQTMWSSSRGSIESMKLVYYDNGKGIPHNEIKKIYDPFFTTKKNNGGSGLGLNVVHNLVTQRLQGSITCKSEVNKYTEFEIMVPLVK